MYHKRIPEKLRQSPFIWEEESSSFDELILSWNIRPPVSTPHSFSLAVKFKGVTTPWLPYAVWGGGIQKTFCSNTPQVKVDTDTLQVKEGHEATGFLVKVEGEDLSGLESLHASLSYTKVKRELFKGDFSAVSLPVEGLSQIVLQHPRAMHLCSPTSMSAVLRYLLRKPVDPILFAEASKDHAFDLHGNWIFNVAYASQLLPREISVWVDRPEGFSTLHKSLTLGYPAIISVQGPLLGAATPYNSGHLMVVCGYDPLSQRVECMDPAFPTDSATKVFYPFADLMEAWGRRHNTCYLFSKREDR